MRIVYLQPGRPSFTSVVLGLISLAVVIGLVIFFLPVIFGVIGFVILAGLVFWAWQWFKMKTGLESEEVKSFREAMSRAEEDARARYAASTGRTAEGDSEVYDCAPPSLEARRRRRAMEDVSDAEEVK